jgi:hypothetical protein
MEIRYLGFNQQRDERAYHFDVSAKGELRREIVITADIALFRTYHVAIQDGPRLCARKLEAELAVDFVGAHTLTNEDLRLHAAEHVEAEAKRAEKRRNNGRRAKAQAAEQPSW